MAVYQSMPLWKNQLALAAAQARQRQIVNVQKQILNDGSRRLRQNRGILEESAKQLGEQAGGINGAAGLCPHPAGVDRHGGG